MAIGKYSAVPPPPAETSESTASSANANAGSSAASYQSIMADQVHTDSGAIDIELWKHQAEVVLMDTRAVMNANLAIPLDDHGLRAPRGVTIALTEAQAAGAGITSGRREPLRRDSMKRREALLKGKEGSRQRRRWEMARLTDVPFVEPPLPSDWCPKRTGPVNHIPYHLAQQWDAGLRKQVENKTILARQKNVAREGRGRVPRDLRDTVKKTPGLKGWIRTLEAPVRQFLIDEGEAQDESDFSDEEVVFVGRKAAQRDEWKKARREVDERPVDRGMIYDSFEDSESASLKRFFTHSICSYYGLDSRSVDMGTPSRRCVYIGIRAERPKKGPHKRFALPQPLWELF